MMHPFERRALEREAQAAADTVARLEQALVVNGEEYECRAEQLGEVRAAVEANHARMETASASGVRIAFDGSLRVAEPLFPEVSMGAVMAMEQAIKDSDRLAVEESRLLGQVTNCERERDRLTRTLEHWTRVRDGLRDGLAALDAPEAATPDRPAVSAPAGLSESGLVEQAEAAVAVATDPEPLQSSPPTSPLSARLAAIGKRIGQW
jgi:hypothetical protein